MATAAQELGMPGRASAHARERCDGGRGGAGAWGAGGAVAAAGRGAREGGGAAAHSQKVSSLKGSPILLPSALTVPTWMLAEARVSR